MYRRSPAWPALAAMALIALPGPGTAQESAQSLTDDVAEIADRIAEIDAEVARIEAEIDARNSAFEEERREILEDQLVRTTAGPFRIVGLPQDVEHGREMIEEAWAPYAERLGRHAEWLSTIAILARGPEMGTGILPRELEGRSVYLFLGGHAFLDSGTAEDVVNQALQQVTIPPEDETRLRFAYLRGFAGWLGAHVGVGTDPQRVWVDLITASTPTGPRCIDGEVDACLVALGIHPEWRTGEIDELDRVVAWAGLTGRADAIERIYTMSRMDRWTNNDLSDDLRDFMLECLDDPEARYATNPSYTCDQAFRSSAVRQVSGLNDAIYSARQSLLHYALEVGPDGALGTIAEGQDGSTEVILESVSGMPLENLVADWWKSVVSEVRVDSGGPDSTETSGGYFWAGFFVLFSFLSTRRRFG